MCEAMALHFSCPCDGLGHSWRSVRLYGCISFSFLLPVLSWSRLFAFFLFFFFPSGIWRFSRPILLDRLALRRRVGASFLREVSTGQLQRPLLLFLFFLSSFSSSFLSSSLPSSSSTLGRKKKCWKIHHIVPTYKKNATYMAYNYRGGYITSCMVRITERAIGNQLKNDL